MGRGTGTGKGTTTREMEVIVSVLKLGLGPEGSSYFQNRYIHKIMMTVWYELWITTNPISHKLKAN